MIEKELEEYNGFDDLYEPHWVEFSLAQYKYKYIKQMTIEIYKYALKKEIKFSQQNLTEEQKEESKQLQKVYKINMELIKQGDVFPSDVCYILLDHVLNDDNIREKIIKLIKDETESINIEEQ